MANINKIKPPKKAVLDLDSALFLAASAAEQVTYTYKDNEGNVVAEFDNARAGKNWIENMKVFGMDTLHGFEGDPDNLARETTYRVSSEGNAFKAFDKVLDSWLSHTPIDSWTGKVAAAAGMKCFRNDIATLKEYKGGRNSRKPHHLHSVRKYAVNNYKEISVVKGAYEADDITLAQAEKSKSILGSPDKDSYQIMNGAWVLNPDTGLLLYSDPSIVGWLEMNDKGNKVVGVGILHLLFQALQGDAADNIGGLPKCGTKGAYRILEPFNNKPTSYIPKAIKAVAEAYRAYYGSEYTYPHWRTGEEITRSWKEIMIENILLLWMKRNRKDEAELVTQHLEGL